MRTYLDASVVVPIFLKEATSTTVRSWAATLDLPPVVSSLAVGEVYSAIARHLRMHVIDRSFAESRLEAIDLWCADGAEIVETEAVDLRVAATFVRRLDLGMKMPDATHAATCRRLGLTLATFDDRLLRASQAIGLDVVAPA